MTEQLVLDLPQRQALGRDAFLVTDSNRQAVHVIDAYADWAYPVQWIYGPSGSGKSHLAAVLASQAPAHLIGDDRPLADAVAKFIGGDGGDRIVIIDPLYLPDGRQEEALFHIFNHALNDGCKLLLLSEQAPALMAVSLPDLQSRLKAVPAVALQAPDDDLLRGVMAKLFADRQVSVDARVLDYLLPRVTRDYASIAALIEQIDRQAMALKRPITVPFVAEILERHISEI